ncbi:MAG: hypothetical protein KAH44_07375, partial [Oricola sp.]|nr:hypothetical protein [Oricola sp.]
MGKRFAKGKAKLVEIQFARKDNRNQIVDCHRPGSHRLANQVAAPVMMFDQFAAARMQSCERQLVPGQDEDIVR